MGEIAKTSHPRSAGRAHYHPGKGKIGPALPAISRGGYPGAPRNYPGGLLANGGYPGRLMGVVGMLMAGYTRKCPVKAYFA